MISKRIFLPIIVIILVAFLCSMAVYVYKKQKMAGQYKEIGRINDHEFTEVISCPAKFPAGGGIEFLAWSVDKRKIANAVARMLTKMSEDELDGVKFEEPENDSSLVVKLRFGETTFLFPSMIGIIAQEDLAEKPVGLKATVLKAPWRGSSAHISPFFLKAVNPEYGLLIQGRKYFGRYSRDCGEFLKEQGAEVHKTGEEGCLIVETDGRSCRILSSYGDAIPNRGIKN